MTSVKIDPKAYPIADVLPLLLLDRTSKENVIFATDSYEDRGELFGAKLPITPGLITRDGACIIQPRVLKDREEQQQRTRKRAEVFTPSWVCCLMIDRLDEDWFGRDGVFGNLDGQEWHPCSGRIEFPKGKRWQAYVDSRRLEITCGEAPYIASRYDMGTGAPIPIGERIGILDRKLRVVNENTDAEEDWLRAVRDHIGEPIVFALDEALICNGSFGGRSDEFIIWVYGDDSAARFNGVVVLGNQISPYSVRNRDGLLYTDLSRTVSDAFANESILDMQGITEAVSRYYFQNGESFDGLSVAPEYQERFDRLAEEAIGCYGA